MAGFTVQREDAFDFESPEYVDLYNRSNATPFQHPLWLSTLYEVLAPSLKAEKLVVTVRRSDGQLVLALPLVRRRRFMLRVIEYADLGVSDYATPVLEAQAATRIIENAEVVRRIVSALGPFDMLRVERIPDTPQLFLSLFPKARAKRHSYSTHLVPLADTSTEWHEQLSPKFVRHLDRAYKRLRPKGESQLRVIVEPTEIDTIMDRLRSFRAARFSERKGNDLLQSPDHFLFYQTIARRSAGRGPARLATLDVGGRPAAIALDMESSDRDLHLLVGYDVENLRNYSLGLLIVDELGRLAISRGQRFLDLTVGDESYKGNFGAQRRPLFAISMQRTLLGRVGLVVIRAGLVARPLAKNLRSRWRRRKRGQLPLRGKPRNFVRDSQPSVTTNVRSVLRAGWRNTVPRQD